MTALLARLDRRARHVSHDTTDYCASDLAGFASGQHLRVSGGASV
jgi:hypothetical protein